MSSKGQRVRGRGAQGTASSRKPYRTPRLKVHGTIGDLTRDVDRHGRAKGWAQPPPPIT
jgi:hypothetical protein